ncbi:MAG: rod shape-determining protein RodA [Hyphomicrobiaceae bacterium]
MRSGGHDITGRAPSLAVKLASVPWPLVAVVALIAAVGVLQLHSVAGGSASPWAERHAGRFALGLIVILAAALIPLSFWIRLAYPLYAISLVMLVLVPLVGIESMGARRWLGAGTMSFQPSEVMKIAIVLALARYYQWLAPGRVSHPLYVALPLLLIFVPVVLVLRQPDLGTAVLLMATGLALMLLAGVNLAYFVAAAAGALLVAPHLWAGLHDYQRRRIEVFLDPGLDPLGAGYHITQSKIALASGGLTGRGFGEGTQSQLDFLPEKHTDFIFTMLAEEWGMVGAFAVLALYAVAIVMLWRMAMRCESRFARLLIAGNATVLFLYVLVNVAMVSGLIPVVGVPLPLISYGGTAMTTVLAGLGLAAGAYVHRQTRLRPGDVAAWP